jgi:hypothetical protein
LNLLPRVGLILILLGSLFLAVVPVQGQAGIEFINPGVDYQFGNQVLFHVQIQSGVPPLEVYLFFQSQGESTQIKKQLPAGDGVISYLLDLQEGLLRPFAQITYWFSAINADGDTFTSQPYSFQYEDNRFTWQTLLTESFQIHWIEGDLAFGQKIENVAERSLASIQNLVSIQAPISPLQIYVYAHAIDLQESLELGGESWVAGHASPDLGIVLVSIPTGQDQELIMEQQIPHEMAHVLLFQKMGANYSNLPVWFSEGFASLAELYPNSDYSQSLDTAVQKTSLLGISSLCLSFPVETSQVFLAYAESKSFTQFLKQNFGSSGLESLIQEYADGLGCKEGIDAAFHFSLDSLEKRWKQEVLGIDLAAQAWKNLTPYLALLGLLVLGLILPGILGISHRKSSHSGLL